MEAAALFTVGRYRGVDVAATFVISYHPSRRTAEPPHSAPLPSLGPALNRAAGATTTMQKIIEQRGAKSGATA